MSERNITNQNIRVRLRGYDHKALDGSASKIASAAKRTGAVVRGPIPMPRFIEKFTLLSSPHIFKKARQQFEIRTFNRLIYIESWTPQTVEALKKLELPANVDIEIKV
jgi:small subunit ribosomal protein S10